jgi:protein TonB
MNIRHMSACSLAAALSVSALNPLSAAVQDAKPVSQTAPVYSGDLRAARIEGQVVVSFTITASGDVTNPTVVSSTNRNLEGPALEAVRKWKFAPATKDGVAIKVKALQPIAFVIPELHSDQATRLVVSDSRPASQAKDSTSAN